jgi:hypothetical protein
MIGVSALGSKPGFRGEKTATNRLNCGMAFVSSSELLYRQLHSDIQERLLFKITYEHQYNSNTVFLPHSLSHFIATVSFFVSPFSLLLLSYSLYCRRSLFLTN